MQTGRQPVTRLTWLGDRVRLEAVGMTRPITWLARGTRSDGTHGWGPGTESDARDLAHNAGSLETRSGSRDPAHHVARARDRVRELAWGQGQTTGTWPITRLTPGSEMARKRDSLAGPTTCSGCPLLRPLTSVSQATGYAAAQDGHLLPSDLGPAGIVPYQRDHWDLRGSRTGPGCDLQEPAAPLGPRLSPPDSSRAHLVSDERVEFNEAIAKGSIPKQAPHLERKRGQRAMLPQPRQQQPHPPTQAPGPHLSLWQAQLGTKSESCPDSKSPKGP